MPELPLVLVVEDEYDLETALADGGFASKAAYTGEEALTLFMETSNTYKALVTDVRLGDGLDGWEVARRIREKEPSLPVIYVTGSSAEDWASYGVPKSVLVSKPFLPRQLIAALSNLLNVGSAPTT